MVGFEDHTPAYMRADGGLHLSLRTPSGASVSAIRGAAGWQWIVFGAGDERHFESAEVSPQAMKNRLRDLLVDILKAEAKALTDTGREE